MSLRKLLSVLCAAALLMTSGGIYVAATRDNGMSAAELEKRFAWVEDCLENPDRVMSGLTGKRYKKDEGERAICAADSLGNVTSIGETILLIDELLERAKQNEDFRLACHNILHEVGREAWKSSSDASLILGYENCGMGYYHGAMTTALAEGAQKTNLKYLLDFCKRLAGTTDPTNGATSSKNGGTSYDNVKNSLCMHGIGHALAGVVDTIKEGVEACSDVIVYNDESDPSVCFTGFLNEYLVVNPTYEKDPVKAVEPCSTVGVEGSLIKQCVKYMLTSNDIPSSRARAFCLQQTEEWANRGCWAAVGWVGGIKELLVGPNTEAGKELLKDPAGFARYVESVCVGDTTFECEDHLFSEVGQTVLELSVMQSICENLSVVENRNRCTRNVQGLSGVQGIEFTRSEQRDTESP